MNWQPIETAPKGGGAERTDDPRWVEPPRGHADDMKAPDLPILDAQRTPCASPKAEAKLSKYQQRKVTKSVRAQVFEREQGMCRCCGFRAAESMHELRPRSLGGKRSLENSIAVCGSGTTGCHGLLQTYRVRFYLSGACGAQGPMKFEPLTAAAIDWLVRL